LNTLPVVTVKRGEHVLELHHFASHERHENRSF
jgi:hypothetical protein